MEAGIGASPATYHPLICLERARAADPSDAHPVHCRDGLCGQRWLPAIWLSYGGDACNLPRCPSRAYGGGALLKRLGRVAAPISGGPQGTRCEGQVCETGGGARQLTPPAAPPPARFRAALHPQALPSRVKGRRPRGGCNQESRRTDDTIV